MRKKEKAKTEKEGENLDEVRTVSSILAEHKDFLSMGLR